MRATEGRSSNFDAKARKTTCRTPWHQLGARDCSPCGHAGAFFNQEVCQKHIAVCRWLDVILFVVQKIQEDSNMTRWGLKNLAHGLSFGRIHASFSMHEKWLFGGTRVSQRAVRNLLGYRVQSQRRFTCKRNFSPLRS
jgi:hypothetical protein